MSDTATTPTPTHATAAPAESVTTSIVLPTYNERGNLEPLIDEILTVFTADEMAAYRPYEIIIVDDSDDGTGQVVRELAERHRQIKALFPRRPFGQSPALAAGFDYASGEFIVPMDADRQSDPHDIPRLLARLEDGYDCVSGWRKDRNDPLSKTIPSTIQTWLATATGPDIHDFGCTLKAYRADALRDIDLYGEGHRYIPAKLHKLGYSVTEGVVNHRPREHGEGRYGMGRLVRGFMDLLFHWFWNRYSSRPLHFFGWAAVLSIGSGVVIGAHAALSKYLFGVSLVPRTPRLILTALLIIVGLLLLNIGVVGEMLTKLYYRETREYRIGERIGFEDA